MALITSVFAVRDSTITSGDNRKTGLTVTWVMLKKLSDNSDVSQPSITEVAGGQYKLSYDAEANGEATGQLDAGSGLTNGSDRYIDVLLTRDSTRIQAGISSSGQVVASSVQGNVTGSVASVSGAVTTDKDMEIDAILGIVEGFSFTDGAVNAYAINIQQGGTVVFPTSVSPAGVPNTNVAGDSPINQVRGTSLPLFMALVAGPQPQVPTDPIPPALDISPSGTYFLFMVKYADADPDTNVPVPDNEALISLDSRIGQITVVQPATLGQLRTTIPASATTITDTYGNMAMRNGVSLRWSLKVFLGDGMGGVASEQVPLSGPYTVYDRSVQVV